MPELWSRSFLWLAQGNPESGRQNACTSRVSLGACGQMPSVQPLASAPTGEPQLSSREFEKPPVAPEGSRWHWRGSPPQPHRHWQRWIDPMSQWNTGRDLGDEAGCASNEMGIPGGCLRSFSSYRYEFLNCCLFYQREPSTG